MSLDLWQGEAILCMRGVKQNYTGMLRKCRLCIAGSWMRLCRIQDDSRAYEVKDGVDASRIYKIFFVRGRNVLIINMRTESLCGIIGLPLMPRSGIILDILSTCSSRRTFGPLNGVYT